MVRADRADTDHGNRIQDYRIAVSNKLYRSGELELHVDGLEQDEYRLQMDAVSFQGAERVDLNLHITDSIGSGLHTILVSARSPDGWQDTYRLQHFVESR